MTFHTPNNKKLSSCKRSTAALDVTSDADLLDAIKGGARWHHRLVEICSLGKMPNGCFQIPGLEGLRVIDSSTFAYPQNCHPQADVYVVAHMVPRQVRAVDFACLWDHSICSPYPH